MEVVAARPQQPPIQTEMEIQQTQTTAAIQLLRLSRHPPLHPHRLRALQTQIPQTRPVKSKEKTPLHQIPRETFLKIDPTNNHLFCSNPSPLKKALQTFAYATALGPLASSSSPHPPSSQAPLSTNNLMSHGHFHLPPMSVLLKTLPSSTPLCFLSVITLLTHGPKLPASPSPLRPPMPCGPHQRYLTATLN